MALVKGNTPYAMKRKCWIINQRQVWILKKKFFQWCTDKKLVRVSKHQLFHNVITLNFICFLSNGSVSLTCINLHES